MIYITTENKTSQEIDENSAKVEEHFKEFTMKGCLLYTSPSPRDRQKSRMPSSA